MFLIVLTSVLLAADGAAAAKTCRSLSSLTRSTVTITAAEPRTTGSFPQVHTVELPGFCRVAATLTPTRESDIRIEVWLPLSGWNGKVVVVGNGGWSGSMPYSAIAAALRRGYAAAGTDTGHEGGGGPWMRNREKLIDFGLIQYHGWADPQIQPLSSVQYFETVIRRMGGASNVGDHYRLFMVPGMAHCGSGEGTSTFDMLNALERWVEHGEAPASIPASRVIEGRVDRTRPLCPYPPASHVQGIRRHQRRRELRL